MLFTRTQKFTALSVPGLSLSIFWIRDDCQQSDREVWMLRKENLWRSRKEKTEIWKKDTMRKKVSMKNYEKERYLEIKPQILHIWEQSIRKLLRSRWYIKNVDTMNKIKWNKKKYKMKYQKQDTKKIQKIS